MTRVGMIGSAQVGRALAEGFKRHGYDVRVGSRTPGKLESFTSSAGIQAGTFAEVAAWGEVLVLCVRGTVAMEAMRLAGEDNVRGKVVIDTTNPISDAPPVDGVVQLFTGPNSSLLELLQTTFPDVRFVKAFNSVGNARMVNPVYAGGPPTMFYCGNDEAAKATVKRVIEQFGWEPADMGRAAAARAIEPLVQLWCIPGFLHKTWTHAFKVLWT